MYERGRKKGGAEIENRPTTARPSHTREKGAKREGAPLGWREKRRRALLFVLPNFNAEWAAHSESAVCRGECEAR